MVIKPCDNCIRQMYTAMDRMENSESDPKGESAVYKGLEVTQ